MTDGADMRVNERTGWASWVTPLTIGAFAASAATGLVLFSNRTFGLLRPVHAWLGIGTLLWVVLHAFDHCESFRGHFKKPLGLALMAASLACAAASFLPESAGPKPVQARIVLALQKAPLSEAARLAAVDPAALVERLRSRGLLVRGPDQTLGEVAAENRRPPKAVLELIFP